MPSWFLATSLDLWGERWLELRESSAYRYIRIVPFCYCFYNHIYCCFKRKCLDLLNMRKIGQHKLHQVWRKNSAFDKIKICLSPSLPELILDSHYLIVYFTAHPPLQTGPINFCGIVRGSEQRKKFVFWQNIWQNKLVFFSVSTKKLESFFCWNGYNKIYFVLSNCV